MKNKQSFLQYHDMDSQKSISITKKAAKAATSIKKDLKTTRWPKQGDLFF